MVDYKDLGIRVRLARRRMKLTQEKLAEKAGLSASFLGHIERGTRVASLESIIDLSIALETTPNDLLEGSLDREMMLKPQPKTTLAQQRSELSTLLTMAQKTIALMGEDEVPEEC